MMHHNHPFPAPPPSQGNHTGNEVANTTESALIAQEEDEDVCGTDESPENRSRTTTSYLKDEIFNMTPAWDKEKSESPTGIESARCPGGHGFDSHRGQQIFSLPRVVPCFPLLGLTPSGLFMGLSSTIIYTSELILCSTICIQDWAG